MNDFKDSAELAVALLYGRPASLHKAPTTFSSPPEYVVRCGHCMRYLRTLGIVDNVPSMLSCKCGEISFIKPDIKVRR